MPRNQHDAVPPVPTVYTAYHRKRKHPSRTRQDDDDNDDDFLIGASCAPVDRKTQYDWQVIHDPEACFQGGRFRWIDVQKSAEAQTWPVGIRFANIHTGQVVLFDGQDLLEQEAQSAPVQVQVKKPYPGYIRVYARKKTVSLAADGLAVLIG